MTALHFPRVRIVSPYPRENGVPVLDTVLTRIEVDGQLWPCTGYSIDGGSADFRGRQVVTLSFEADVTVEHEK
jgi:hypothetical protein